ncbi:MAG: sortase [Ilumatobacteraceae bacterium]
MNSRTFTSLLSAVAAVLLLSGALMAGFVVFLLYGTGIETRIEQRRLLQELESTSSPELPAPAGRSLPTTANQPHERPAVDVGDPLGQLSIPAIGAEWVFVSGIGEDELRLGPGHFPGTPLPGEQGNMALAGHRTTHGAPFSRIDEIDPGDEIILTTPTGEHRYISVGTAIVGPADYSEISTQWPTIPTLSLVSCHPKYSTRQRIIVHAVLAGYELPADSSTSDTDNEQPVDEPDSSDPKSPSTDDETETPVFIEEPESAPLDEVVQPPVVEEVQPEIAELEEESDSSSIVWVKGPINPSGTQPEVTVWVKRSRSAASIDEAAIVDPFGGYQFSASNLFATGISGLVFAGLVAITYAAVTARRRRYMVSVPATIGLSVVALYFFYSTVQDILPAGA